MLLVPRFVYRLAAVCLFSLLAFAVEPVAAPAPNTYPTYQELRNVGLSGEAVSVSNLTLHRDENQIPPAIRNRVFRHSSSRQCDWRCLCRRWKPDYRSSHRRRTRDAIASLKRERV